MATLTENANRIKNGAADIKDWILAQGVTPTGNIETFRAALDGIEIPKAIESTFVANTADYRDVPCGFKPKALFITSVADKGDVANSEYFFYFEDALTIKRSRVLRNSSNALQMDNAANINSCLELYEGGFRYKSRFNNGGAVRYMAIG